MPNGVLRTARYCALWFPTLPTDRLRRLLARHGDAPADPMVVVAREKSAMRLVSVDAEARRRRLNPGLALADARARVPELAVFDHAPQADRMLLSELAAWCERYTPLVVEEPPDGLLLDIGGATHFFSGERGFFSDLIDRVSRAGLGLSAAVAGTPEAARALARFGPGGVFAPGEEDAPLRALPIEALELDLERHVALRRAGLSRLADIADLPPKPLAARFGSEIVDRLAGLFGQRRTALDPRRPLSKFLAERRFADPIGLDSDIAAALRELADALCIDLARTGRGGRVFVASFFRSDGAVRRIEALSGRALRDPAALADLFAMRLDALPDPLDPGFGFDMIRLAVVSDDEAAPEQSGFAGETLRLEALSDLLGRLVARFGPESLERFSPFESHVPERAVRRRQALAPAARLDWLPPALPEDPPARPVLMFSPPQAIGSVFSEAPDGPPHRFEWRRVVHDVASSEGPERIAPEWWRPEPGETRDYYRVEDTAGRRFWLFREGLHGQEGRHPSWFVHGLFP